MSTLHARLDDKLTGFIKAQKIFFVATAPLGVAGHVNVSPKGYDSLAVIDARTIAYLDLGGSGAETLAHVRENGRITLMFCAFQGPANVLRIHGRGRATSFGEPGFAELKALFPNFERARAVIVVEVDRIAESCGWGVPVFEFKGEREQLRRHVDHRPFEEWAERRYASDALSIDGLPALVRPE
ncbi:MAG TPA: pyridoxamine 5'-phosphate oxidase family protein [Phenylobacterium sp.]|uniref:pyridoxamine 5'-phosphate oxidase family protein n=1 Tax=Phenylobacterium sp. TaxID=1871053 RepID=UPI002BCA4AFF|nr:pyridoxamine 5'-phosphate oxidase family protein [Phenylobacterium sp.]HSV03582.1 pyridoxamine 5'-phosphate oxidase family protein [Phenylobacterium sp.]